MSNPVESFRALFVCQVCRNWLCQPATLSCGHTVCRTCMDIRMSTNASSDLQTLICPLAQCNQPTYLSDPHQDLEQDARVNVLCKLAQCWSSTSFPMFHTKREQSQPSSPLEKHATWLLCSKCQCLLCDPVTTHCGHSFCKLCLLQCKIDTDTCLDCLKPLPDFDHLRTKVSVNHLLAMTVKTFISVLGSALTAYRQDPFYNENAHIIHCRIFLSGRVILPHQFARVPIVTDAHMALFRTTVFQSGAFNDLCLVSMHRSHPRLPQYGTVLRIKSMERRKYGGYVIDVIGLQRFRVTKEYGKEDVAGVSCPFADVTLMPDSTGIGDMANKVNIGNPSENNSNGFQFPMLSVCTVQEAAEIIHAFIKHVAKQNSPMSNALEPRSKQLIGPHHFEVMQAIHGPLPEPSEAPMLVWWAASFLPVSDMERYGLLRIGLLCDRMSLVLSWMRQLDSQWHRP